MKTEELIKLKIKSMSSGQLEKVRHYIETISVKEQKKRVKRAKKNLFDEYFGIYNYSANKIGKELKNLRTERNRDIEISI
jgi:hypothetical protein